MSDVEIKDINSDALAAFTSEGLLPADVVDTGLAFHEASSHASAYAVPFGKTPTGVNDEFFYLKNDSSTDQLVIEQIVLTDAGSETIIAASCTGTPGGSPVAITPVNRLLGSTETADATAYHHTDITGLTLTTVVNVAVQAAFTTRLLDAPIILRPGEAFCLSAVTGTAAIVGTCYFREHKHPTV